MSIPEGDSYLPENHSLENVFDVVNKSHFTIGSTLDEISRAPFEKVSLAAADYVTASVAYFANRGHSDYAQTLGTVSWRMINKQYILPIYSDNIPGILYQHFKMPLESISRGTIQGEPVFLIGTLPSMNIHTEKGFLLLPTEFVHRAITNPVEALASMAFAGSQILDTAHGRQKTDRHNMGARSAAFESDFLLHAKSELPDLELSSIFERTIRTFPKGMDSIPERMRYTPRPDVPLIEWAHLI